MQDGCLQDQEETDAVGAWHQDQRNIGGIDMANAYCYCPDCLNCIYYRGFASDVFMCNYYLDTGKRRPCPPGKDCTVRVPRKRIRKKKVQG